jgi:uncharacterized membrane protein YgdD (TMEM256/DUF423 family)
VKPNWIAIGAIFGALAVILGAFGAHALKDRLDAQALDNWKTAVLYHALHAIALVMLGLHGRSARAAGWSFAVGIVLFSGSLYGMSLGGPRWLAMITPFGGVLFISGWVLFALAARARPTS